MKEINWKYRVKGKRVTKKIVELIIYCMINKLELECKPIY